MADVIDQRYKGTCELGPWHGQGLWAERKTVTPMCRPSQKPGFYFWHNGAWLWTEPDALIEQRGI